jgi:anti-sigma B factor antagonist
MKYTLEEVDKVLVVTFEGDLIGANDSVELMEVLNEKIGSGFSKSVVNMKNVRYMNSSGIGILITMFTKFRNKNGNFVICNASEQIVKLLNITKLDSVMKVFGSFDEALEMV